MNKLFYILIFELLLLSACIDKNLDRELLSTEPQVTTSAAVPIGYKQTSLKDIFKAQLDAGTLIEDSSGLLWLKYKQEFDTIKAVDLIQFPAIAQSFQIINNTGADIDLNTLNTTLEITDTFYIDFGYSQGVNGEIIDSIRLENLDLQVDISSVYPINGFLEADFINTLYHEKKYYKKLIINSSNQFNDLEEYSLHLTASQSNSNLLPIVCTVQLSKSNAIIPVNSSIVTVDLEFYNLDYAAIYGYIGQFSIDLPAATTVFDFYNERISGDFNFDHVSINLLSDNSFGLPFSFYVHNMYITSIDQQSQEIVFQEALSAQNPALPAYPNLQQEGQSIKDSTSIDISTLKLFSENYATEAVAEMSGETNPNGNSDYNFVLKNSMLNLDLEFAIPFWGSAHKLVMQDTLPFVLKDFYTEDFSSIHRLLFILNSTNAFPIEASVQIYFCNENYLVLDSLYSQKAIIQASTQNETDERIEPSENEPIKAAIEQSRILKIENTSYVIIQTEINTIGIENSPPSSWKFFSDYYLYAQIGVAADIESNP